MQDQINDIQKTLNKLVGVVETTHEYHKNNFDGIDTKNNIQDERLRAVEDQQLKQNTAFKVVYTSIGMLVAGVSWGITHLKSIMHISS